MKTKRQLSTLFLGAALVCAPAFVWSQQPDSGQNRGAKQDMRDAGHETNNAAKDAGHGAKQGTKHAYHSTKRGTRRAWNKTKDTTRGAANGAKEGAREPEPHQ